MRTFGHVLVAATISLAVTAAAPAAHAGSDGGDVASPPVSTDVSETVRTLATRAASLVDEERQLLRLAAPENALSPTERSEARTRLRTIDAEGADVLAQLDQLDIDVTGAARTALERLPTPDALQRRAAFPPPDVVYRRAVDDLTRIASTPEAVAPPASETSPTFGLLAVGALALLALGAAALGNALRRRPDADELAAMAWSDGLTGLANRRRLDHDVDAHTRGCARTAVIMIDVDHFKAVNDAHGHQVGDEVLRQVAVALSDQVRAGDVVYRYGGEEFCVLLPDATVEEAASVAERIVVAAREIVLPDGEHVTVSVGVADAAEGDVTGALASADRALYDAKDRGRDRAATSGSTLEPA